MPAHLGSRRIVMLAPSWIPVQPPGYGGIESVVALLCDALVARGRGIPKPAEERPREIAVKGADRR